MCLIRSEVKKNNVLKTLISLTHEVRIPVMNTQEVRIQFTLITLTQEVRIPVINTPEVRIQFILISAKNSAVNKI